MYFNFNIAYRYQIRDKNKLLTEYSAKNLIENT